jgi:sortase (surface protein transpeptidase)
MRHRIALLTLTVSSLLLVGVVLAWRGASDEAPRADLVGAEVVAAKGGTGAERPRATTTTSAPTPSRAATAPKAGFVAAPTPPPVQLAIPSIGVDVAVRPVGLRPGGDMEIPAATEAGWYSPGPHPTSPFGSSVIAAHIDYAGEEGAFFRLPELQVGQEVRVRLADGSDHAFRVTERMQVPKDELRTDEIFRRNGPPTLTLVTCGGAFDRSARHYQDNIVVRAVPV